MGRGNKGAGSELSSFFTCLRYQILLSVEKIHLAQGAVKMRKKMDPFDHALSLPLLQPPLPQNESRTPPHLKSVWSLGKEMKLGEEHKARTSETSFPLSTSPLTMN
jgi:hypothetical protein